MSAAAHADIDFKAAEQLSKYPFLGCVECVKVLQQRTSHGDREYGRPMERFCAHLQGFKKFQFQLLANGLLLGRVHGRVASQ